MNANATCWQRNTCCHSPALDSEKVTQVPKRKESLTQQGIWNTLKKPRLAVLWLLAFACAFNAEAAATEPVTGSTRALISQLVLGTIGIDPSGKLAQIQGADNGTWLGGWNLSLQDTVVPRMIGDFDGDGVDDFVIRSGWGIGILGNDAKDNLDSKALTPYGTSIGQNWILSNSDKVVAVGRFGSAPSPAMMVLKGETGFARVRASQGDLQAVHIVPYGTWIWDATTTWGWRVGPRDKIIGVGRLNGRGDCLVVTSDWGLGIWEPNAKGLPTLVSIIPNDKISPNDAVFTGPNGATWTLDTTDPRFRFLGAGDTDKTGDNRAEMVLVSSSGLAILHKNAARAWGAPSLDLRFVLKDGEYFRMRR